MSKKTTYSKSIQNSKNAILSNMYLILNSRIILYFILILSIANLFYLVTSLNYMLVSIFILVGFITSFFSKNMIVILCIALTITNILQFGDKAALEGFGEETSSNDTSDDTNSDDVKSDAIKSDAIKSDAIKSDAIKSDAIKSDAVKSDAVKSNTVKSDAVKSDAVKSDIDELISKSTNTNSKNTNPKNIDDILNSYKELLTLQGKIQDGMHNINGPLTEAEDIIKRISTKIGISV